MAELGSKDPNADARDVINAWLRQVVTRAEGTEHHKYLVKMLGYGDISKELPIEAEAAVEEIEAKKVAETNPEEVLKKGMADALAKEIEDEIDDEKDDTDESINHMKKLAGVMSSNKALRPKKNEHQTTPRSIHKRK